MSQDPLIEKLAKANRNVGKLCEFFAARKEWRPASDADQPMRDLAAAAAALQHRLAELITSLGAQPAPRESSDVALIPAGTLDGGRVGRFATFLSDLDAWFAAQTASTDSSEGLACLQEMESNLTFIVQLAEASTTLPEPPETPEPSDVPESPAGESSPATVPNDPSEESLPVIPEGAPLQVVFDHTEEAPLVHEWKGIHELNSDGEKAVDDFLAAWGLEYSYYNRKKLLERVLRWIMSAPERHALVMKMKTAEEPFEPYPSYVARDLLAKKNLDQES